MPRHLTNVERCFRSVCVAVVVAGTIGVIHGVCVLECDQMSVFTDKHSSAPMDPGQFYQMTSVTHCKRIWHTTTGLNDIAGTVHQTEKYRIVACLDGVTLHCYGTGGVCGECKDCLDPILGGPERDIECYEECIAGAE